MNRDKMIDAIAKAIYCHKGDLPAPWDNVGDGWEGNWSELRMEAQSQAAAVLELMRPKRLVWEGKVEDCFMTCDLGHKNYDLHVSDTLERSCDYEWSASYQEGGMGRPLHLSSGTLELAQAAAQDHADAAHWGNTPIGAAR